MPDEALCLKAKIQFSLPQSSYARSSRTTQGHTQYLERTRVLHLEPSTAGKPCDPYRAVPGTLGHPDPDTAVWVRVRVRVRG